MAEVQSSFINLILWLSGMNDNQKLWKYWDKHKTNNIEHRKQKALPKEDNYTELGSKSKYENYNKNSLRRGSTRLLNLSILSYEN